MKKVKFLKTDLWSKSWSIYFGTHKRQIRKKLKKVRQRRQRYSNFQYSVWVDFQVVNIVFWIWSRQFMKQTFCFCCCLWVVIFLSVTKVNWPWYDSSTLVWRNLTRLSPDLSSIQHLWWWIRTPTVSLASSDTISAKHH